MPARVSTRTLDPEQHGVALVDREDEIEDRVGQGVALQIGQPRFPLHEVADVWFNCRTTAKESVSSSGQQMSTRPSRHCGRALICRVGTIDIRISLV